MAVALPIAELRRRDMKLVENMFSLGEVNTPIYPAGAAQIASLLDTTPTPVTRLSKDLKALKALNVETRHQYEGRHGITAIWTLLRPLDEVKPELQRLWQQHDDARRDALSQTSRSRRGSKLRAKGAHQNGAERKPSTIVYIAGDSNPTEVWNSIRHLRMDEAKAAVEVVRQWRNREQVLDQKVEELEKAGIMVDRMLLQRSVVMATEDRATLKAYAAIAQVLPYVEDLERANDNFEKQRDGYRAKIQALEDELRDFREADKRRKAAIAQGVGQQQLDAARS